MVPRTITDAVPFFYIPVKVHGTNVSEVCAQRQQLL